MYDTNNFFEIKKKNDKVVVRAKLPTESEATEQGQLYREAVDIWRSSNGMTRKQKES